jgi:adenine specific DNA methylase Mod
VLCDEVFGEENFVANVIWEKKYTISNDAIAHTRPVLIIDEPHLFNYRY